jgi:CRISPR-associated exonuclease Cas4
LQHFAFCRRQWALIHVEHQWAENYRTVDGSILHEKAHGGGTESRGDLLIVRAMRIHSAVLGVSGECDVVEFHRSENGVTLQGRDGLWSPFPIEYKRGKPKPHDADELQLCAQAMCLEEMLCCQISDGALFYGEPRRRTPVAFTDELRQRVRDSLAEMHDYLRRGCTPKVKPQKGCSACSLKELCLPELMKAKPVSGAHGRVRNRQSVAPFAGAWIEMLRVVLPFSVISVAPFAGAWIEISEK